MLLQPQQAMHRDPAGPTNPSSPTFPRSTSLSLNGAGQTLALRPGTSLGSHAASPVRGWDLGAVARWLSDDVGVPQHVDTFRQHDITGSVLFDVDQAALKEMGIRAVGDRVKITVAIKQLRQRRSVLAPVASSPSSRSASPAPVSFSSPPRARGSGRIPPPLHLSQSNQHPAASTAPTVEAYQPATIGSGVTPTPPGVSRLPPPLPSVPPPPPSNSARMPSRNGSAPTIPTLGGMSNPNWLAPIASSSEVTRGRPMPSQPKMFPNSSTSPRPPLGAPPPRPSTSSTAPMPQQLRKGSAPVLSSARPATANASYGHSQPLSAHPYGAGPVSPTRANTASGSGRADKLLPSPNILPPSPSSSSPPTSSSSAGGYTVGRGPFARPTTPGGLVSAGPSGPLSMGLDAVMRKAVKFSSEDGQSKMVAVNDCVDGQEIITRVLKKFGKEEHGQDKGWGIFATTDSGASKLLSPNELLSISQSTNAPERQRGLTVSRLPGSSASSSPTSPSRVPKARKLGWMFGDSSSPHPDVGVEPPSPKIGGSPTPSFFEKGKTNRASTVSILSSLQQPGAFSPAPPPPVNFQNSSPSAHYSPGVSTTPPVLLTPGRKLRNFFGQRPPSELITNHLTEYFPKAEKNKLLSAQVRKSVRRSMVRRESAYSMISAGSGGSGGLAAGGEGTSWEKDGEPQDGLQVRGSIDGEDRSRMSLASSLSTWTTRRSSGSDGASMVTVDEVTAELEERRASLAVSGGSDESDEVPEGKYLRPPSLMDTPELQSDEEDESDDGEVSDAEEESGDDVDDVQSIESSVSSKPQVKWIRGALIGSGSFGSVYLGMNPMSGSLMAVKQVELPTGNSHNEERKKSMLEALEREIELLKNLQHENIVQYLNSSSDSTHLNIFLEYVPGGSVAALLSNYGAFEEALVSKFVRQILTGLEYLHDREIIHRDIKGANILVNSQGGIKISDFGISKKVEDSHLLVGGAKVHRPSLQGSVYWMAPEVVKQEAYTSKADVWSLGCLVVEMLTGVHPWANLTQMQAIFRIGSQARPTIPDDITPEAEDFLEQTFEIEYSERPSAKDLLAHPFIRELEQATPTRATFKEGN